MTSKQALAQTDSPSDHMSGPASGGGSNRKGRLILALILLGTVAVAGRMWWRNHNFEETDNAYLAAHISMISPRIPGVVHKVLVTDNQLVRTGDALVELDAADQEVRIAQVKAQMAQMDEQIQQIAGQLKQSRAEALAAQALVARSEAQFRRNDAEARRLAALYEMQMKSVSKSELEAAAAMRDSSSAELLAQKYQAEAASAKSISIEAARAAAQAQNKVFAAQLREAEMQLKYTHIVAPVSGRIGKRGVEVGARVQAGQQLLAIVQDDVWTTANFKETQLHRLYVGQQAKVRIDAFPGQEFTGRVDSFAPASGAQFALLPSDNATGNFTKIVQRIPVKIVMDAKAVESMAGRMAPGMSAVVEIDLRQGNAAAVGAP